MIDAKNFLGITREIIEQQIRDRSTDAVCEIESVNEDGTLNVFVLPDKQTILKNINILLIILNLKEVKFLILQMIYFKLLRKMNQLKFWKVCNTICFV